MDLTLDLWNIIVNLLDDNTKFYLLISCKYTSKCQTLFSKQVNIDQIKNSHWFNNFSNVIITEFNTILPKSVNNLQINTSLDGFLRYHYIRTISKEEMSHIPNQITNLVFCYQANDNIKTLLLHKYNRVYVSWRFYSFYEYIPECIDSVEFILKVVDFHKSMKIIKKDNIFISNIDTHIKPSSRDIMISISKSLWDDGMSMSSSEASFVKL